MLNAVRFWILISTLLVSSGWILSAFHQLNRKGYALVFGLAALAFISWQRRTGWHPSKTVPQLFYKFRKRFRRVAPLIFLALLLMSLLGGYLYLSNNGDSNAYRIPRVLHWLGRMQWHWIATLDARMNFVGCNFEWLSAPLVLFTRTNRWIFLINVVSYLMLPGLIFSVFRRLGVAMRVAWWWMWLLPSGWCFVMQAGSDSNDSFAAVYALAMVDLALRGRECSSTGDLWLSMLAAALATGVKQTEIPMALLWLVAVLPSTRQLFRHLGITAITVAISGLISALPITVLNIAHTGNWHGIAAGANGPVYNSVSGSMPWKVIGNVFSIPLQNLVPPLFPQAESWNRTMQRFLQTPLGAHFAPFERFGYLSSGVSEAQAGIGLGICVLMLVSLLFARRFTPAGPHLRKSRNVHLVWLRWTPWILLLVFMAELCNFENARYLSAYYPLLFPLLLALPGNSRLVRRPWWQYFGLLVMLSAASILAVSRDRPLFPERAVINALKGIFPRSKFLAEVATAYSAPRAIIYVQRYLETHLPPGQKVVGYATTLGVAEPGLWWPFGQRRVERVLPTQTPGELRQDGIHCVVVDDFALEAAGVTIEEWMHRYNGELLDQLSFLRDRHSPPAHLYLVVLRSVPRTMTVK